MQPPLSRIPAVERKEKEFGDSLGKQWNRGRDPSFHPQETSVYHACMSDTMLGSGEHDDEEMKEGEIEDVLVTSISQWKSLYQVTCQVTKFNI